MNTLKVVHVAPNLHPGSGGPSRTVVQLTDALAKVANTDIALMFQSYKDEPSIPSENVAVNRWQLDSTSFFTFKLGVKMLQELSRTVRRSPPAIIHSHGIWHPVNHWASLVAQRNDIPLVSHPRGMLEPWAIKYKGWKKRVAMEMYQRKDLETTKLLMATSVAEYENLRGFGLRQPIAVIPNGIHVNKKIKSYLLHSVKNKKKRTVLFLSRIHPKKGLFNLVQAWGIIAPQDWCLRLVGPDEGGHLKDVMAKIREIGIADSVEYVGELDGASKSACYGDADIFVLPTYSENFGVVVAEALSHCLPVITTRGAPWGDLVTHGCGWWIDIGVEPLVDALREAMKLSDDERRIMGLRGREYVRQFDWDDISSETIAVYRWVLAQGPRPNCVIID